MQASDRVQLAMARFLAFLSLVEKIASGRKAEIDIINVISNGDDPAMGIKLFSRRALTGLDPWQRP